MPKSKQEQAIQPRRVNSYSLPSEVVSDSLELRLDAIHYNHELLEAMRTLEESGMRIKTLSEITERVFIPPRFKRIYVDQEHGVPFVQGSHVVHFQPADIKYLSRRLPKLEQWIIRPGWILVTCSGTIGRAMISPDHWDGWAASHHILRIVPDEEKCPLGYLCAFLQSPLGQIQLTARIYGAVVDELTEHQTEGILVPLPDTDEDQELMKSVDLAIKKGTHLKSSAIVKINNGIGLLTRRFNAKSTQAPDVEVPDPSYQPSRAELREDLRLKGTFKEAVEALVKPTQTRKVMPKKGSK